MEWGAWWCERWQVKMFKNKQLINSDSDQSLTATTTTFETFEANEPTNNFGQSGKRVKQVRQTRQTGRPLSAIQTWQGAPARTTENTKGWIQYGGTQRLKAQGAIPLQTNYLMLMTMLITRFIDHPPSSTFRITRKHDSISSVPYFGNKHFYENYFLHLKNVLKSC